MTQEDISLSRNTKIEIGRDFVCLLSYAFRENLHLVNMRKALRRWWKMKLLCSALIRNVTRSDAFAVEALKLTLMFLQKWNWIFLESFCFNFSSGLTRFRVSWEFNSVIIYHLLTFLHTGLHTISHRRQLRHVFL